MNNDLSHFQLAEVKRYMRIRLGLNDDISNHAAEQYLENNRGERTRKELADKVVSLLNTDHLAPHLIRKFAL